MNWPTTRGSHSKSYRDRLLTFAALCLAVLVGIEAVYLALAFVAPASGFEFGQDYRFYRDVGTQWLASGQVYLPRQLAGPYVVELMVDVLYPPIALWLFVPFAFLPAVLWWVIPICLTLYVLRWLHPAPWALVAMLALMTYPASIGAFLFGNTNMWAVAAIAAGIRWGWPAVALVVKPVFLPFALVGVRHRSWWIVGGLGVLLSLPMLPLWLDYVRAMSNMSINSDYSLGSIPLMLVPLCAWRGGRRQPSV